MTQAPRTTTTLNGRYELGDVIGRGGMADVYRGHDLVLERPVAVKILRTVRATEDRARFASEARVLASLDHPGLVTLLDADTSDEDHPYLVTQLIDGTDLAQCCNGSPMDPARVAVIGAQLAETLAHAHASGVVHRDLKPANVLLAEGDRALLADFGVARLLGDQARLTATGMIIGTAAYLAPEQVKGEQITPGTDVYSLGLLLLKALTGEAAFQGTQTESAVARLTLPPSIPASLPSAWRELLGAMTRLPPDERPTMEEIARDLRRLSSGTAAWTATAASSGPVPRTSRLDLADLVDDSRRASRRRLGRTPLRTVIESHALLLGAVMVVLAAALVLLVMNPWDGGSAPAQPIPTGVPSGLRQPLQDLHDAVGGTP